MTTVSVYSTLRWRRVRAQALARDGNRCTLGLLGGPCSSTLHVHHLTPVEDGGAAYDLDNLVTACDRHHPMLEAFRRALVRWTLDEEPDPPRCRHYHRTDAARQECEARMRRQQQRAVVPA